jgi:hypothetical protein
MPLCPFCMTIADMAPSIFREEPCSPVHCINTVCCLECQECSDWFTAIEPEEGKVSHPKAARISHAESVDANGPQKHGHRREPGTPVGSPPPPVKKKPPEGDIPW